MAHKYGGDDGVEMKPIASQGDIVKLTPRQAAILQCLAGGLTCKEIAAHLHVQPRSIYFQVALLKAHFGVNTLAQLVSRAVELSVESSLEMQADHQED
jgi:DNA-binding CsgD family transcriptional regulator